MSLVTLATSSVQDKSIQILLLSTHDSLEKIHFWINKTIERIALSCSETIEDSALASKSFNCWRSVILDSCSAEYLFVISIVNCLYSYCLRLCDPGHCPLQCPRDLAELTNLFFVFNLVSQCLMRVTCHCVTGVTLTLEQAGAGKYLWGWEGQSDRSQAEQIPQQMLTWEPSSDWNYRSSPKKVFLQIFLFLTCLKVSTYLSFLILCIIYVCSS